MHPWIIQAADHAAKERHFVGVFRERAFDVFQIAIAVQMIGIDVGNPRDAGREGEKRVVVFVGLHHDVLSGTHDVIGAIVFYLSAHNDGGVKASRFEHHTGHRSGGGFSVGSRNTNAKAHSGDLSQHFRPAYNRDFERFRGYDLGIVVLDGG